MWGGVLCLLALSASGVQSASAQVSLSSTYSGERLSAPQAVQGFQPTSKETSAPAVAPDQQGTVVNGQPGYSPQQGWTAGPFRVFPVLTAGLVFDDNVFAAATTRRSDWFAIVRPELGVRWDGPSSTWAAQAFVEERKYSKFTTEDQLNGSAALGGTIQTDPDGQIVTRVRYIHAHEDRGVSESLLFPTFDRPVAYNTYEATVAANRRWNNWWASVGTAGLWVNYDNPTITGLGIIDQTYRNGKVIVGTARVGYVVAPFTSVFVEGSGNGRVFGVDAFSSTGYRVVGGVLWEPGQGAFLKGEVFGGVIGQTYTGVTFQSVSTWTFGAALAWLITPQLTATFEGRREAKESALAPVVIPPGLGTCSVQVATTIFTTCGTSLIETLVGARLDYAIVPTVIIGAGATYLVDEFLGGARTDRSVSPLASLKWLASRNVTVGLDYRYLNFNSSGLGVPTYYRNVYLLSVNARF